MVFNYEEYNLIILSLVGGLISLLGSVGIFVSLTVQRRVERLQELLEELIDLSYDKEHNITRKIFQLIQKYQMYYILPHGPSKTIMQYLDFTMTLVTVTWLALLFLSFTPPFRIISFIYLIPVLGGLILMVFYRKLLQNAINPLDNQLFNAIIPPPVNLRSVSFLSSYVNVSVHSILQQARLSMVLRRIKREDCVGQTCYDAEIVLKEELSFDDFFYLVSFPLNGSKDSCFVAYGHLQISFPPDPVTRKPIPINRNVNITLGWCNWSALPKDKIEAKLYIFPLGEKHPILYQFIFLPEMQYYTVETDPLPVIDRKITFTVTKDNALKIIDGEKELPCFDLIAAELRLDSGRKYLDYESSDIRSIDCIAEVYIK
ncbi:hypothetical protein RDV78_00400 [Bacillota bacterium LX-D]|nr:hypothetical protein [Bacillota bacterium LX-D]